MRNKKAFTLIELISVLVILAILALIVTPLVLNIIKKARIAADKRSIDAYGRSIEIAIADYLLDNGTFPTSIDELTIEYSGDRVVCSTTQIKSDSSVYLAGCTVGGRRVDGYAYGKEETVSYEAYSVGDEVTYNKVDYYVIEDSNVTNNTVKLLKKDPLLKTEIDELNLVDITMNENNSYGYVQYGSSTDYEISMVKKVVDAWADSAINAGDIASVRLITFEELHSLGYNAEATSPCGPNCGIISYGITEDTPSWVYNNNYSYWTMGKDGDYSNAWLANNGGALTSSSPTLNLAIRPVILLSKSVL